MIDKEPKIVECEHIKVDDELDLRALKPEEAGKLYSLTEENRQYLGEYLPWVEKTNSADDSLEFIKSVIEHRATGEEYGFGIFLHGELVGHASLMHLTDGKHPEIGYWIKQSVSGKGLTKKAAQVLTELGFSAVGLNIILIRADVKNTASNKIAEALGYVFDGTYIDEDDGTVLNHWVKHK